jgi:hypothetical protein
VSKTLAEGGLSTACLRDLLSKCGAEVEGPALRVCISRSSTLASVYRSLLAEKQCQCVMVVIFLVTWKMKYICKKLVLLLLSAHNANNSKGPLLSPTVHDRLRSQASGFLHNPLRSASPPFPSPPNSCFVTASSHDGDRRVVARTL